MTSCPPDTINQQTKGVMTVCELGSTTYANSEVKKLSFMLVDNEVISIILDFKARGQYANSEVVNAIRQKYGVPVNSKAHINQYSWKKQNNTLIFDGWKGYLALIDYERFGAAEARNATSNQKDM